MLDQLQKLSDVERLDSYLDYLEIRGKLTAEERKRLDQYFEDY